MSELVSRVTGLIGVDNLTKGTSVRMLRITVTCDICERRQILAEPKARGSRTWLLCHSCETSIFVDVPE